MSALWPTYAGPSDLAAVEAIPLADRGLPESTTAALARAAELWPDRPAVSFLPDAERWDQPVTRTFAQLATDVWRTAALLRALGVARGDAVALVAPNCAGLLTALLAAETAGIAAPINPGLTAAHATGLAKLARARVIVAAGPSLDPAAWELGRTLATAVGAAALLALEPTGAAPDADLEPLEGVRVGSLAALAAEHEPLPLAAPRADDLASLLHTGGTTGAPKLAARTHANEVANGWMVAAGNVLGDEDAGFAALPLFHTNALIVTVIAPLLRGQHVVWAGPLGYRDVPLYGVFWRLVERYRIAAMSAVPTVYAVLGQVPTDGADISTLQLPIVGAAPLPPAVAQAWLERTGAPLCEGYGLTEATCATSRSWPDAPRPGTVGQRLPYQPVKAVAIAEDGTWTDREPGETGTLVIAGPTIFAGYVTADGIDPGDKVRDGWLDTGDLGSVDADGFLTLAGRAKDLIIRGGHNIDPAVIEDALLAHPQVTGAGAVGRPDAHAGEVPVAYVTLTPEADLDEQALIAWATERVPERAAAPKHVEILAEIPLTAVGKPFKPELRRRAAEAVARELLGAATAHLDGGDVRIETTTPLDDATVTERLEPFGLRWSRPA
jgi:fatty-acyl-CoA synthase